MRHGTLGALLLVTSGGHHWRPVQKCSLEDPPLPPLVLTSGGMVTKARTVGKQAVRILLECFLVCFTVFNRTEFFLVDHKHMLLFIEIYDTIDIIEFTIQ